MNQEPERRILILAANPQKTTPLRLDREVKAIEGGLRIANHRNQFVIVQKWAVNPTDMQRAILETNPHIVHFCGHGTGAAGLILESETGSGGHIVTTAALANLFSHFKDQLKCVVLNACYSEAQAEAINQHIDYVIGMNHAIGDAAAIDFSIGFYDALWAGRPIDFAFSLGCSSIQLNSSQTSQLQQQHLIPILKVKLGLKTSTLESTISLETLVPKPEPPNNIAASNTVANNISIPNISTAKVTAHNASPKTKMPVEHPATPSPLMNFVAAMPDAESVRSVSMQPRYTTQRLTEEFIAGLEDFSDWIETDKIRNALGRDLIRKLRGQEKTIRDRLEADFSIVVVGDFKRGKSTLINALLGMPVVSTAVTTETVSINEIEYGEQLRVEAHLKDGRTVILRPDQLSSDHLRPILQEMPNPVSHLRIEAPVDWLKGLKLVDTPGTGDMMERFDKQIHRYLSKADVLLYVMFSSAVLSESERAFLTSSVLPQDFPKVFFIINRLDELNDANTARLLNRTSQQIADLFPSAYTFGISALDECARLQGTARPNLEQAPQLETAFQRLRGHIYNSALLHKETIQLDRATDLMDQMLISFETSMSMVKSAIQADKQKLNQAVADCESNTALLYQKLDQHNWKMRQNIDVLCQETLDWMNHFISRIENNAIPEIAQFELADVQKHYHFFLTDMLRRAVSSCLDAHSAQIVESVDVALKLMASDFRQLSSSELFNLELASATFGDMPWTNLDTMNLLLEFSGTDGIFELASHLLLRQAKQLQTAHGSSQYAAKLKANCHHLRNAVQQEISLMYANIAQRIETDITESYQQTIESSNFALRQAQELSKQDNQQLQASSAGLTEAITLLVDTRAFLQSFKQKLWVEDSVPLDL